jgi:two-component system OmpR family response regulator
MAGPVRVVVVDDDEDVRSLVRDYLAKEGMRVRICADETGLRRALADGPVDVVLLDIRLPGKDGVTLASELRGLTDAGIIMLSAKDELIDRVAGLEAGADDYITKPFHLRELLARVHSLLRRRKGRHLAAAPGEISAPAAADVRRFAGWRLDVGERTLTAPDGRPVELTTGEFDLLLAFLDRPGEALSRDYLLDRTAGREATVFDRSVDVQVGRLRRKIEPDHRRPTLIRTVRGLGYKLDVAVGRG